MFCFGWGRDWGPRQNSKGKGPKYMRNHQTMCWEKQPVNPRVETLNNFPKSNMCWFSGFFGSWWATLLPMLNYSIQGFWGSAYHQVPGRHLFSFQWFECLAIRSFTCSYLFWMYVRIYINNTVYLTQMTIVLIGSSALFWGDWPLKIEVIGVLGT